MRRYAPNDAFQDRVLDLLALEGTNWLRDWYPTMAELDSQIPGVGLHWLHGNSYPHAHYKGYDDWDTVIRTLRYVPMHLCTAYPATFSRDIAECSIQSVEECLHKLGAALGVRTRGKPMGRLCSLLQYRTGVQLADDIKQLNPWLIMAKHHSTTLRSVGCSSTASALTRPSSSISHPDCSAAQHWLPARDCLKATQTAPRGHSRTDKSSSQSTPARRTAPRLGASSTLTSQTLRTLGNRCRSKPRRPHPTP